MSQYPSYQVSKIQWIEQVPTHWTQCALKHVIDDFVAGGTPSTSESSFWADTGTGTPWVAIGDMSNRDVVFETEKSLTEAGLADRRLKPLPAGSVLYSMYASVGYAAILDISAVTNQAILGLDHSNEVDSRYLRAFLNSARPHVLREASSNTQDNLNAEKVKNLPFVLPPLNEQLAIANYLDTETKRIDGLIEEKAGLLKLVQKLSIALIDDAIEGKTHIDDAATLDSWEKARLRFKARVNPRASVTLDDDAYVSFLPMEAIGEDGSLQLDETRKVADVAQGYTFFEEGDVTIAKITPCFENRKGAVMSRLVGGLGFGTTELIVLRPEADVDAKFLYYLTQSSRFRLNGEASMTGSGGQKRVSDLYVKDFETKWPPLESQKVISKYIEMQLLKNADLIRHVESELDLLKELRASTITDAVLGRIDVRQATTH